MDLIRHPADMLAWTNIRVRSGKTVALTPTMGFFHEGHLSLMRRAGELCDQVVVSLFVNPTQFGLNEDLDRYPRDFERDMALARQENVAAVFAPPPELMYPQGFQSEICVRDLAMPLCGLRRPGHFTGVATVVTKLFHIVQPAVAVFGEKDYQQLAIIRRMVRDLNIPVRIVSHPIVREADGLAMSSRNVNLDPNNRAAARSLSAALGLAREQVRQGVTDTAVLTAMLTTYIHGHKGTEVDYVSFVDGESLAPMAVITERTVLALAVRIDDKVRLIDNGLVMERPAP